MTDPSDRELADLVVLRGDEAAFRTLYRRHAPALFRIAVRLLADGDRADDALQDTWIRAIDRLPTFEWRSRLATWLTGILLNRVREGRRADARGADPLDPGDDWPAPHPAPEDGLDLETAVANLPPGYRTVLVLHDVEGYRHHEIAGLLHIDIGTSKSQLARARARLRAWLEPRERSAT